MTDVPSDWWGFGHHKQHEGSHLPVQESGRLVRKCTVCGKEWMLDRGI